MTVTKTYEIDVNEIVDRIYQDVLDTISDGVSDYFYDNFNEYWFDELGVPQQKEIYTEVFKNLASRLEEEQKGGDTMIKKIGWFPW